MTGKRFEVILGNDNEVAFTDMRNKKQLLFIKFNNKEDAERCKNAIMYQCNIMNELSDENKELKQRVNNKIKELEKERKSAIGGTWHSDKLIAQIEILEELKNELKE